jgi:hypothetical protein
MQEQMAQDASTLEACGNALHQLGMLEDHQADESGKSAYLAYQGAR